MKTKDYSRFEWVKVKTYLTIINHVCPLKIVDGLYKFNN